MPYKRNVPVDILPDSIKNLIPVTAAVEPLFAPDKVICPTSTNAELVTPVQNTPLCKVVLDGFGIYITKLAPPCAPSPDADKSIVTKY